MDGSALLQPYLADEKLQQIAGKLREDTPVPVHLKGPLCSGVAVLTAALQQLSAKNFIFIATGKEEAAFLQNDLQSFFPKREVLFFPDSFRKPGQYSELHLNQVQMRTEAMNRFMNSVTQKEMLVTYPEALAEEVVQSQILHKATITIRLQAKLSIGKLTESLVHYGFERVDFVYEPGQFSLRGDIIDIFSFGSESPYRIELFGEEVESIRLFDPLSQLSEKKIALVHIVPNIHTQFQTREKTSFLTAIGPGHVIVSRDFALVLQKIGQCHESATDLKQQLESLGAQGIDASEHEGFSKAVFVEASSFRAELQQFSCLDFNNRFYFANEPQALHHQLEMEPQPSFNKNFNLLLANLQKNEQAGLHNFIFSENTRQLERLRLILDDLHAKAGFQPVPLSLSEGFIDRTHGVAFYTDHQIFERYHRYKLREGFSRSKAINLKLLRELKPGDFVTHIDHGVGVFSGLEKRTENGMQQEMVRLIYRDNDLLYVSIQSLHKISKYVGKEGTPPRVSKLGSDAWEKLKSKTKSKVKDIATDLIKLYAKRKASPGFAFSPDSYLQTELEASFIYEDTPDQLKATQDAKRDMEKAYPMDRLVCGDVGFGKTEVAIRAAFKATADSKQVAVLVPTTILAIQHWKTFQERLKEFPVRIDYLNRFKTPLQQKETIEQLEAGKIDILIGTSAIIGKKVKFKDLGLLIIDEEQKFGVAAKEQLRSLRASVDTLTLTATPIPRTLQFSLLGARDLSIINTPPPNRQPIETEVLEFHADRIREAIEFEVYRGGQVYFIHNRVRDINEIAGMLKNICPNVEYSVAHGQMEGELLEQKMIDFIEKKTDVLVCTNIVESGLDIANANTIIINEAQHHGLSDLHQLRGRVGRSNKKAFCYLLTPPVSVLTTEARKRLQTIEDFAALGSGFQISMRDMDIRGAGNLLGGEQSGFMADIGYDTYHKILDEAITELKHTEFKELYANELMEGKNDFVRECTLDTEVEMLIPDEYVQNIQERLTLYTELDSLESEEAILTFEQKLSDRFGKVPQPVYALFDGLRLRNIAVQLGFEKIILKQQTMRCFFPSNMESAYFDSPLFAGIIGYVSRNQQRCQVKETAKNLILTVRAVNGLGEALRMLQQVASWKPE